MPTHIRPVPDAIALASMIAARRLAVIREPEAEPVPLYLDDCYGNLDRDRVPVSGRRRPNPSQHQPGAPTSGARRPMATGQALIFLRTPGET